jgi:hypothetical protein
MTHDPLADLKILTVRTLIAEFQITSIEARRVAAQIDKYVEVDDDGGPHFELLSVTVKLKKLCMDILDGRLGFTDGGPAGLILAGVLRWFCGMRLYCRTVTNPRSSPLDVYEIGHVEAAACLALLMQETDAEQYSPDDTMDALFGRVDAIIAHSALLKVDDKAFRESIDRLRSLGCLTQRNGFLRLRDEVKFQIPEE